MNKGKSFFRIGTIGVMLLSILSLFTHCGGSSGGGGGTGAPNGAVTLNTTSVTCNLGDQCFGGTFSGVFNSNAIIATLGACADANDLDCVNNVPQDEIRSFCEKLDYNGFSDWKHPVLQELTEIVSNYPTVKFGEISTSLITIGGGISPVVPIGNSVTDQVQNIIVGSRVLCVRRLDLGETFKIDLPEESTQSETPEPTQTPSNESNDTFSNLKDQTSCNQGRMEDLYFKISTSGENVSGYMEEGSHSGDEAKSYFGLSANGDILKVTKVINNSNVLLNVTISFCNYSDSNQQYIGKNAGMSNFYLNQVVLNKNSPNIVSGQIGFYSATIGGYVPINIASAGLIYSKEEAPTPPPEETEPEQETSSCPNGDPNDPGISDNGQSIEYYRLNNPEIVAHGASYGEIVFSSDSDLPSYYNQNIFFTDKRFNLRVIPKYHNGGVDSRGKNCAYNPSPFDKMNIGVVVRSRQSEPGVGHYYQFKDVPVNCPSKVHQFQVPSSSEPLVIEVMNVEWDYGCKHYAKQGYPNHPEVCPYDNVWKTECYNLEIQFSTDTTKDLPN